MSAVTPLFEQLLADVRAALATASAEMDCDGTYADEVLSRLQDEIEDLFDTAKPQIIGSNVMMAPGAGPFSASVSRGRDGPGIAPV
jgi:hypothetical protein